MQCYYHKKVRKHHMPVLYMKYYLIERIDINGPFSTDTILNPHRYWGFQNWPRPAGLLY
jgi:hypothetical protein